MKTEDLRIPYGEHGIPARVYRPNVRELYRSLVVVVHGVMEHSGRYRAFAESLVDAGHLALTFDLPAHGVRCDDPADYGRLGARDDPFSLYLTELEAVVRFAGVLEPELPIFVFGHSFGSLISRVLLPLSGADTGALRLDGAILSGTAADPGLLGRVGARIVRRGLEKEGPDAPAERPFAMSFGTYARKIPHARTPFDWLSRDPKTVDRYQEDPACGFAPSYGLFAAIVEAAFRANDKRTLAATPRELSIYLLSGARDPVGGYGRGVMRVYRAYRRYGVADLNVRVYPGARHEVLNETNRAEVLRDITRWLNIRLDLTQHIMTHYP